MDIFLIWILAIPVASLCFLVAWLVYIFWVDNPAVVDLFWSLSLLVIGMVYATYGGGSLYYPLMMLMLLAVWALRLSMYVYMRGIRQGHRDARYEGMADRWGEGIRFKFLLTYLFQGMLSVGVSVGLIGLAYPSAEVTPWFIVGIVIFLIGFGGEILSDRQLRTFIANRSDEKSICREGLWKWSRHPNLFFEWVLWVGFSLMSASVGGYLAWLCPIILLGILLRLSIPMTEEESRKRRGASYLEYQKEVRMFVPLPQDIWEKLNFGKRKS